MCVCVFLGSSVLYPNFPLVFYINKKTSIDFYLMTLMEIVFQSPPGVAAQPGDPDGSFPLQRFVGKQHVPQLLVGRCLIS